MPDLLKGVPVADAITADLIKRADALKLKGIMPRLAVIRVGENDGDLSYERGLEKRFSKIGITVDKIVFPDDAAKQDILSAIRKINDDDTVHGCLLLRPLKDKDAEREASMLLKAEKDVDCMTPLSMASVFTGFGPGFAPCTPQACIEILKYYGINLAGANVAVIGRSNVIGKPVSVLLQNENATVTMCHTKTRNLAGICRQADIIVAAAGRAKMLDSSFVSENQIIVDVGINVDENGKLCGDVDFDSVAAAVKAITPVPGGVGAVTTSILASHVVSAAESISGSLCG